MISRVLLLFMMVVYVPSLFAQSPILEDGAIDAVFSTSDSTTILFSRGNLQYNAALSSHLCADGISRPGTWRFAPEQYMVSFRDNLNRSATYDGWIDLFAYGASGYNGFEPYDRRGTRDTLSYEIIGNLTNTFYDFGVYNAIENGGNEAGIWRMILLSEWNYIINQRQNANSLRAHAVIGGVHGVILLPDDCDLNSLRSIANYTTEDYDMNEYSLDEWHKMEALGAVFLPCGNVLSNHRDCRDDLPDELVIYDYESHPESEYNAAYMVPFTPSPRYTLWNSIFFSATYISSSAYLACSIVGISVRLVRDTFNDDSTDEPTVGTRLENNIHDVPQKKIVCGNNVYILNNDKLYNLLGQEVNL